MKKNMTFNIREITAVDAPAFLKLRNQSEKETPMMGYRTGERQDTVEQMEKKIQRYIGVKDKKIFVAESEGLLIGFVMIYGQDMRVYSKTRNIAIAVIKKYWGLGVGSALMSQAIDWSKKNKVHRLELDVWANNDSAIRLYEKFGFKKDGLKKESILINKKFVDVVSMGLLF
jgi:RimJ/RimL family protein N-acetyltransferase